MLRRRLPRLDLPGHTYFLTCCLEGRGALFERADLADALVALYLEARDRRDISLHGYVVMPDHYHVLLTLRGSPSIGGVVRRAHSAFARMIRRALGIQGRIWQRRFYDHVIRDEKDWREKLTYMHDNPVRAGLAEDGVSYRWSSCRFWETGAGPVACDPIE
jgi:putative transposase